MPKYARSRSQAIFKPPAAGRGLTELTVERRYRGIELSRFGYGRVVRNASRPECGIL